MFIKKIKTSMIVSTLIVAGIQSTFATENGLQSYPIGVDTVLDGIVPAPSQTQFYNYTALYTADRFAGPNGGSVVPNFKVNVFVDSARVLHTWGSMLGPFTLTSGIAVPLIHAQTTVPVGGDSRWGLGDVVVHAMKFGYSNESHSLFSILTFDFSLPTGSFSNTKIAATGTNYYAFIPNMSVTVFPVSNVEFSATGGWEINSPNHKDGYHSGNVLFLDWVAGYSISPQLQLGVQGYALRQITDDTLNGNVVEDGFRGRVFAIGPQIRFNITPTSGVVFKWQHEFAARNRPQGDRLWIELTFPLKS
ncbi:MULTISPECIES: transporter [Paraburkholderia]|uniref:SphA family protein n=1 Tax=Paraburkholderia TaxID=1822464 RepID=UPI0022528D96|nr:MULTISPECIES: transporter [Paraburkholderia]MCX4163626.1 transporter [Paraburkholderia megapolitana]MDN7159121.1 transporter [Paraburkholderia sp. CHISQ3]MDQ6496168.1 transporter [Paraburkholderia megapolitana]